MIRSLPFMATRRPPKARDNSAPPQLLTLLKAPAGEAGYWTIGIPNQTACRELYR